MAPFFYLPHVIFIAERGLPHFDLSMLAQYELTKRFTAESSIRGYIAQDPERAFRYLREWANDSNPHVRRLVSEGTRLRLPWAARVPWLDRNPARVIELLDMLKDDPTTLVRRSIANSLNDLSKVHPQLTTQLCDEWLRDASRDRQKLVEHAMRSAVKKGDSEALRVLGYGTKPVIQIEEVTITPRRATIGQTVSLSFALRSEARVPQELLVDLIVNFPGASGKARRKVFKVKRVTLPSGGVVELSARVSLAVHTTRKPFPGVHRVEALINGIAFPMGSFSVRAAS
jgi:3-methyladenine DNA glycosylase AlkC